MKVQQINDEKVEPIPIEKISPEKIKGYKLFPNVYANIFLVARKKSGKTSVINKIVKSCIGKDSVVHIFASTIHKDPSLLHIVEYLEKKGKEVDTYNSVKEDKVDNLANILKDLQVEAEHEELMKKKKKEKKSKLFNFGDEEEEKEKKPKKHCPKHIFIFDDIGNELKLPSIAQLLKTNRHLKSKVIISSQYLNDLSVQGRKNIDYWLLFKGHTLEKLETIYKDADLSIPFEDFVEMYETATEKQYNFFYIDCRDDEFRINFNYKYLI